MEYAREYPSFSACGLNCGLCPRYHTNGTSKCPGCAGEGFLLKHPSCSILSCNRRKGIEFCYLCDEYPCKKYNGADLSDSFITHKNQLNDFDKAKRIGLDAYNSELNNKVNLLEYLLENFDDGRRKSFFCIAVNLLELQDINYVLDKIAYLAETDIKIKSAAAVSLFEDIAKKRNISLKLRKKPLP